MRRGSACGERDFDATRKAYAVGGIDFQLRVGVDQRPSGIVNDKRERACRVIAVAYREVDGRGGRRVIRNVECQTVAGVYDVADLSPDDLSVKRCAGQRNRQAGSAIGERKIPIGLLVPNQFTGKNWIVEPANLGKRIFVKNSYGFTLRFLHKCIARLRL